MNIKFLKTSDPNILKFVLSDTYVEFANALRRALISEVPVMSISKVNYLINNSAFYNELLASRLGLIPLKSDVKTYVLPSECSCKGVGCSKCTVKFTLDVTGPGVVYARDLKSSDARIVPVYPDMPIIKLFEGQSLKLEAEAVLGTGREHARFNACMAVYQYYPKISVNGCSCRESVETCPKKVYEFKNGKVVVNNGESCDLCLACVDACRDGKLKVDGLDDKFIFTVESWGQYEPKDLLKIAVKTLQDKVTEFSEKVLK